MASGLAALPVQIERLNFGPLSLTSWQSVYLLKLKIKKLIHIWLNKHTFVISKSTIYKATLGFLKHNLIIYENGYLTSESRV